MSDRFKLYKRIDTVRELHSSGLLEEIERNFQPSAIVLFGSASKGEDTEESDIDLLIVSTRGELDTSEYEKSFKREINLQFMTENELKTSKKLTNSIANGIVLKGYLTAK